MSTTISWLRGRLILWSRRSSETSVHVFQITKHYIEEDSILHSHSPEHPSAINLDRLEAERCPAPSLVKGGWVFIVSAHRAHLSAVCNIQAWCTKLKPTTSETSFPLASVYYQEWMQRQSLRLPIYTREDLKTQIFYFTRVLYVCKSWSLALRKKCGQKGWKAVTRIYRPGGGRANDKQLKKKRVHRVL
jgi:hypothetical protein